MGSREQPARFNPRGVVDCLDGGQVSPGGLQALTDLIFDPSNPFTLECRPAAIKQYAFADLTAPGVVSVAYVVGNIAYGMIKSTLLSTYDQPFAYNLLTNVIVSMTGTMDESTLPLTVATTGNWTPATMALVGPILYITHPGFVGGDDAFFAWIDTTDPAAPVYYGGNTATNALPSVPTAVGSFNDSAWFACLNVAAFTDAGNNTPTMTNSGGVQAVTIGDSIPITGFCPLPIQTSTQGILQALIAIKPNAVATITGASALGTLAVNVISSTVGSSSVRTFCATPKGVMFMANDGIRTIDTTGNLQEPNEDLKTPFIFAINTSRASAGYNNSIYRISVQNGHVSGNPIQEYWYDLRTKGWTGPHTFVQSMCCPWGGTFAAFSNTIKPALFTSDVIQSNSSTFVENAVAMTWLYQTAPLADDGGLFQGSAILSVIDMELPADGTEYRMNASDVSMGVLSFCLVTSLPNGNFWGNFNWGNGFWTPRQYGLQRYNIPWDKPLVFTRLVFQALGPSSLNLKIGKLTVGNKPLKYVRIQ